MGWKIEEETDISYGEKFLYEMIRSIRLRHEEELKPYYEQLEMIKAHRLPKYFLFAEADAEVPQPAQSDSEGGL